MNERPESPGAVPPQGTEPGRPPRPRELAQYFRTASFITSAARFAQCPAPAGLEVAFAGRSNAGKSSALNLICDQKQLARTSKTPGRTQLINFFGLADEQNLVDLPGYGYAKVSENRKREWQRELERYLQRREPLAMLVLLVDCRHELQAFDQMMLEWAGKCELRCHVLLTKSDKLSRNKARQALFGIEKALKAIGQASVQLFSATSGEGLDQARLEIYQALHPVPA